MLSVNNIDIQDILYGGVAGELPLPEISDSDNLLVSGQIPQLSQISETSEILSYSEATRSTLQENSTAAPYN